MQEPLWRYINPKGTLHGPFPAERMVAWYQQGHLSADLPVYGVLPDKVCAKKIMSKALICRFAWVQSAC